MNAGRRTFIAALLGAPAALFALARVAKAQPAPPVRDANDWMSQKGTLKGYPYAAVGHQRVYTKLEQRCVPINGYYSVRLRTAWITGTTRDGERDTFRQLERFDPTAGCWVVEDVWRIPGGLRHGSPSPAILLCGPLHLDCSLFGAPEPVAEWAKDAVAIARWTERGAT